MSTATSPAKGSPPPKVPKANAANPPASNEMLEAGKTLNMERIRFFTDLFARAPELSLEESTQIRETFHEVQGEKENVTTTLELRILLGRLGLYPEEEEMLVLLDAYRSRVSFTAICQYMRFYKKEFQLREKQEKTEEEKPKAGDNAGGWQAFSGQAQLGDADTLKAFVALGGEEEGTGRISAQVLVDTIRKFDLTIDIEGMIAAVDVHQSGELDYRDFCTMWALPEAALRRSSVDSFSSLNPASSAVGEGGPAPPVRKNNNNLSGNDPSLTSKPVSRQGSERMMTLNRRQLLSQIATSRKPSRITGESVTPVANVRFRERQEDNQKNELGSPITDEEHLFLLKVYLYPELRQQLAQERNNQRKLHFAEGSNSRRGSQNNNYLTHSRRPEGTLGRSAKGTKKKEESAENYLSLKQGGYQPPDPMILSMRNSTKTRPATKKATPKLATTQKAMMNSSIGSTGSAQTPSQYNNNNKFSSTA